MLDYTSKDVIRFWSKVEIPNISGTCWNWKFPPNAQGYGQFRCQKKTFLAHRIAWELTYGEIPPGLLICHHCDNKQCCNPTHLFVGTDLDNLRDASRKGRMPAGEKNGKHKLTWAQVDYIRQRYFQGGISMRALGREFNVSHDTISNIIHERIWIKRP